MIQRLHEMVRMAMALGACDLHLKTAFVPIVRVANTIERLELPPVSPKELEELVAHILDAKHRKIFTANGQVDCSFQLGNTCRVRSNIFFQRNSLAMSMRLVAPKPPELETLGFPKEIIDQMLKLTRGLILITGATNSGKSTTAASIIHLLAKKESHHIITIEDPIEFVFPRYKNSIVSQRQVGEDTPSFMTGLTSALRQDPDIVLIGEIRDQETVETCLKAAETGHLVLGTLHTSSAVQSITRLINIFPSHQRDNIRFMLSSSLKLVLSQVLLPTLDHKSRVLAYEVLPMIASVCNLIRQKKLHEIHSILRLGQRSGCVPMNETVKNLIKTRQVQPDDVPEELLKER